MAKSFSVKREIGARPERIWSLLTDAKGYPDWNPAVISLRGRIAAGERIALVSAVDPKRTFELAVSDLDPPARMVWSNGMPLGLFVAARTFSLRPLDPERTEFSMREQYSGLLAGLIVRSIPDLTDSFAQFADGLKSAAESAVR